jgi:hypothetical protein
MMEAARTSETLVNFYQTTRRYDPEDSHLRTHRRENLKSYLRNFLLLQNLNIHHCPNTNSPLDPILIYFNPASLFIYYFTINSLLFPPVFH